MKGTLILSPKKKKKVEITRKKKPQLILTPKKPLKRPPESKMKKTMVAKKATKTI